MNQSQLETALTDLSLGAIRFYDRIGSTNDEAAAWAGTNAPDLALIVADEQTSGKGRAGRIWHTPPGAGLAFSLVLYPTLLDGTIIPRMTALGALAVCEVLKNRYHLPARIKWPNDVLIDDRKVAGILVEAQWTGERLKSLVLGVGLNLLPEAVKIAAQREGQLRYPATSLQEALGKTPDCLELLYAILAEILRWRPRLASPEFVQAWEKALAFRGEWVQVSPGEVAGQGPLAWQQQTSPQQEGQLVGLTPEGSLKLRVRSGDVVVLQAGEIRLLSKEHELNKPRP